MQHDTGNSTGNHTTTDAAGPQYDAGNHRPGKERDLTPEQFRDRLHAIDMLAREAHDTIVDAEFEQEDRSQQ